MQVGIAKRSDSKLPFAESIEKKLTDNKDFSVNNLTVGSFAVTPELRWYTGGNYGKGTLNLSGTFTSKNELSSDQKKELEKFVSDNLQDIQKGQVKDVNVEVNVKDKKISVKDMSTPWVWLRISLSIGIRF